MPITSLPPYKAGLGTGDAEAAILGTGESGPEGVESTLEFNGLYLNIRQWLDTYLVLGIDGLGDADVRDVREVNPAQDGETPSNAYYGGRTISITGRIRAHHIHKSRDMQQALRQAFADISQEKPLVFHTANPLKSLVIPCKKLQPIAMSEAQQNYLWQRDFQISLRASNPRFIGLIPQLTQLVPGEVVDIENEGSYFAQPIITFSNRMVAPRITNELTGRSLIFSGDILSGETVTADLARRRITNQNGENAFKRISPASGWPELAPGLQPIALSSSSFDADALVSVTYRHSYM